MASGESDTDRSNPTAFVGVSVITTKIETKLAADHRTGVATIKVDTDKDGVVWMSGSAGAKAGVDQALSIARRTKGVKHMYSDIKVN